MDVKINPLKTRPLIKIVIPKPSANSTNKCVKDKKYRFFVIKKSNEQNIGYTNSVNAKIDKSLKKYCKWIN